MLSWGMFRQGQRPFIYRCAYALRYSSRAFVRKGIRDSTGLLAARGHVYAGYNPPKSVRNFGVESKNECRSFDGKALAAKLLGEMKKEVNALPFKPKLCIIQVGDRKDSDSYIRKKKEACEKMGMLAEHIKFPVEVTEGELISEIRKYNTDPDTHGIIVQQPLPSHIHVPNIDKTIAIVKDVDAFHPYNVGLLANNLDPTVIPCTARAVIAILDDNNIQIEGKRAVVLGRSQIVGSPVAALLQRRNATVTVCHSKTVNAAEIARQADILVVAIGKCELIDETFVKPGAVVIDVGIHFKKVFHGVHENSKTIKGYRALGDVKPHRVRKTASMLTPVPGGVGPLTVSMVLRNTITCAKLQSERKAVTLLPLHLRDPVPSDGQISSMHTPKHIRTLAEELRIPPEDFKLYGRYKAKIDLSILDRMKEQDPARYVLVTGMTPTKFGEGKSTTLLGLCQAFARDGKTAYANVRQPSLGPTFGMKGGAAGGGYAQVIPMTDMNLHLTGDSHAITAANNLLAAQVDTRILHEATQSDKRLLAHLAPGGRPTLEHLLRRAERLGLGKNGWSQEELVELVRLNADPESISWRRVLDSSDRALREIKIGLAATEKGLTRTTGFDMTAASEVMAILALASSLEDLRDRLMRISVGQDTSGRVLTADDFGAGGAMAVLLKEALEPTLMQTIEGSPVLVHGGPFANIAHGNSSIIADEVALCLAGPEGYVVTEAGFGSDMGMEKFFHIKCRVSGRSPDCIVVVGTIKAIKMHGVGSRRGGDIIDASVEELREGCENLARHVTLAQKFGVPAVVALNVHSDDTHSDLNVVGDTIEELTGVRPVECYHWSKGGEGCLELAEAVERACAAQRESGGAFTPMYTSKDSLLEKMVTVSTRVYGADGVRLSEIAEEKIRRLEELGYGHLPICMSKTQYSLSHDPKLFNVPSGFTVPVRDVSLSAGAGFVIAYLGDIQTMPGLPTHPTLMDIDLKGDTIVGLS